MNMHPDFLFIDQLRDFNFATAAYCFIFSQQKILMEIGGPELKIPLFPPDVDLTPRISHAYQFGYLGDTPCIVAHLKPNVPMEELHKLESGVYKFIGPRNVGMQIPYMMWQIIAVAMELDDWHRKTMFCGQCGEKFAIHATEFGKKCISCGLVDYPRLSPAVIMAITKNNQILLAHNARFPGSMHSVLAGFVNPGENLEDAVKREIKEEAGIDVKNIEYYGSQPWPFPNSLMLGFTAEYAGGTLTPDGVEIDKLGWFDADKMPTIPPSLSISRKLIDNFIEKQKSKNEIKQN